MGLSLTSPRTPARGGGREGHRSDWKTFFAELPDAPPEDAPPRTKMTYKLQTQIGRSIYRLRKCTVEPVIGIIKELTNFHQVTLGKWPAAAARPF